jgi:transcription elongation factor GreA
MERVPVTVIGYELLKEELTQLETVERPHIITAISEARAHGDLRENAEYHAAKERQSFIEGRILELKSKISRVEVINPVMINHQGHVVFGATVLLCNVETEEEIQYQIVGEDEADIKQNKISFKSPIARSMIGKECSAVVTVTTPAGMVEYEIINVEYIPPAKGNAK